MVHFAQVNKITNIVKNVIVCDSHEWCVRNSSTDDDFMWIRTYYSTSGKNFASIGFTYHPELENFSAPQPYPSWTLDNTCRWQPPVAYPEDGKMYVWNEETLSWDESVTV